MYRPVVKLSNILRIEMKKSNATVSPCVANDIVLNQVLLYYERVRVDKVISKI